MIQKFQGLCHTATIKATQQKEGMFTAKQKELEGTYQDTDINIVVLMTACNCQRNVSTCIKMSHAHCSSYS